jgi:hypothetical protein
MSFEVTSMNADSMLIAFFAEVSKKEIPIESAKA